MSKVAAALAAPKTKPGPKCGVATVLSLLDDIDRQALLNALNSDMYATDISRALWSEKHDVSGQTIQRHRKGECSCGRR